jgi:hypothetical protein
MSVIVHPQLFPLISLLARKGVPVKFSRITGDTPTEAGTHFRILNSKVRCAHTFDSCTTIVVTYTDERERWRLLHLFTSYISVFEDGVIWWRFREQYPVLAFFEQLLALLLL